MSTSVEVNLKPELPAALTNIPGNAEEGGLLIENKNQIDTFPISLCGPFAPWGMVTIFR